MSKVSKRIYNNWYVDIRFYNIIMRYYYIKK